MTAGDSDVRFRRVSGHRVILAECLLLTQCYRSATTWRSGPEGLEDFKHLVTGPGRFAVTTSYREDLVHPGITFGSGFEKDRRPKIKSGGIHRLAAMDLLDDMSGSVPEPSV